jgi:hypothetical protein
MSTRTTYEDKARDLVTRCRPTKPWGPTFDYGPEFARGIIEAGRIQDQFASELGVKPCRRFWHNMTRLVNRTFDTPYNISAMKSIIDRLTGGPGDDFGRLCDRILNYGETFDHAAFWSYPGCPCVMVGHPAHLSDENRVLIDVLAKFEGLKVSVDGRPSYTGHGTHHVRIQISEIARG